MAQETWWKGPAKGEPDFENLRKVLRREVPGRPTLFEFFLNGALYRTLAGSSCAALLRQPHGDMRCRLHAYRNAGYDYTTVQVPGFGFPHGEQNRAQTISLNEGNLIGDRKTFESCIMPDPEKADYGILDALTPELPGGMQMIVCGPGGVLENVIALAGYDNLCFMIADDEPLVRDLFHAVGSRLVAFYARCLPHERVGAIISNDDWGFRTQTMLSPADMRRFVFPWHKRIVELTHRAGKPAILHSCGNLAAVMDEVIDDMGYDGKHSFEDAILPVEQAYDLHGRRIAILGGLDLDFVCRSTPQQVYARAQHLLERTRDRGSYALGTGNSVPDYAPQENYFAMIAAAVESR